MLKNSTTGRILRAATSLGSTVAPDTAASVLERLFLTPIGRAVPSRETAWLVGARPTRIRFDGSRTLCAHVWGEDGPTVLLVHGWAGRGSQLGVFAAPLVARGFRVVAYDAPAHGASDGRMTGLPELVDAVRHVASVVGGVRHVVAHSLGTAATTIAASRGLAIDRAVYIAPPANPGEYLLRTARSLGFTDAVALLAQKRMEGRYGVDFAEARTTALASELDVPLAVFHDRGDRDVPFSEGQDLVTAWPGATLIATEGLGHHRILRHESVVGPAVDFLAGEVATQQTA